MDADKWGTEENRGCGPLYYPSHFPGRPGKNHENPVTMRVFGHKLDPSAPSPQYEGIQPYRYANPLGEVCTTIRLLISGQKLRKLLQGTQSLLRRSWSLRYFSPFKHKLVTTEYKTPKMCDIQSCKIHFTSRHILHQHLQHLSHRFTSASKTQHRNLLTVVSATSAPPIQHLRHQWNVCHRVVSRFTRRTLPTANISLWKSFAVSTLAHKKKTHNISLLFGITLKHGRHFDYRNQPVNIRVGVCYLDCHEAGLCCYLVIHIENLLRPLQLFYFHLWPILPTLPPIDSRPTYVSVSPHQLYWANSFHVFFICPHSTCPAHVILLDIMVIRRPKLKFKYGSE
jgi:hypothetical protein